MGVVGDRPFNEVDTRGFRTELKLVLIFSYAQKFETSPSKGRMVTKTVQYRVRNPGTAIFLRTWLVQKRLRRLERLRLPLSSYRVKAPPLSQTTRPFISIFFVAIRWVQDVLYTLVPCLSHPLYGRQKTKNPHRGKRYGSGVWCPLSGSNRRPTDYKSVALPTELKRRGKFLILPDQNRYFKRVGRRGVTGVSFVSFFSCFSSGVTSNCNPRSWRSIGKTKAIGSMGT